MAYDLEDITERVREYIAARHPNLCLDDNCSLTVVPAGEEGDFDWMFFIQYSNPAMTAKHLEAEFMRYTTDMPIGTMETWQGTGNDYITVRSGRPLLVGDGDDSGAVKARDGLVRVWLRAL
jgi:hypothetical protein